MKKLFLIMPLMLLGLFSLGCGGDNITAAPVTTQPVDGTVSEAAPRTANIDLTSTTPQDTNKPAVKSVSVLAEKNNVAVGDSFQVVVVVDIMDEMSRGVECGFTWTPSKLVECTEVADGDFYAEFSPVDFGASAATAIHNDEGIIDPMSQFCTSEPIDAGATGKGVVYIYYFTAKAKGEVTFSIPENSMVICDITGDESIPIESYSTATVVIQ